MKFRIQTKGTRWSVGPDEQQHPEPIKVNVTLEFEHEPNQEDARNALEKMPSYQMVIWNEMFKITKIE